MYEKLEEDYIKSNSKLTEENNNNKKIKEIIR
jgi:hypothetical protein